jgi:divalent metal cation (Fe/Co/Zn/Cd) transporter
VFVSVPTGADSSLPAAHALASRLEDDVREGLSHMIDVVVHTEPKRRHRMPAQ